LARALYHVSIMLNDLLSPCRYLVWFFWYM